MTPPVDSLRTTATPTCRRYTLRSIWRRVHLWVIRPEMRETCGPRLRFNRAMQSTRLGEVSDQGGRHSVARGAIEAPPPTGFAWDERSGSDHIHQRLVALRESRGVDE